MRDDYKEVLKDRRNQLVRFSNNLEVRAQRCEHLESLLDAFDSVGTASLRDCNPRRLELSAAIANVEDAPVGDLLAFEPGLSMSYDDGKDLYVIEGVMEDLNATAEP